MISALMAVALSLGTILGLPEGADAQQGATLRIDPASSAVDGGETFMVSIIQNAGVATIGAQTNLAFDPDLLQILDMQPGPAYSGGLFLYGSADDGSSASVDAALASANDTGLLKNVATFLLPGGGSLPPGDVVFVEFTVQARNGAGGTSTLEMNDMELSGNYMLDEAGTSLPVTTTSGTVTVRASAVPSGGAAAPSRTETPTPTQTGAVAGAISTTAAVTVAPVSLQIDPGAPVRIDLKLRTDVEPSAVTVDLAFDTTVIEITNVEPGPAWSQATILGGTSGQTLADAIAQANETGVLRQVGVFLPPGGTTVPIGEGVFLTIAMLGRVDGTSALTLAGVTVLDSAGGALPVNFADAELVVGTGGGGDVPLLPIGLILAVALIGAGLLTRARRRARP